MKTDRPVAAEINPYASPAEAEPEGAREEQRAADVPERACQCPRRHPAGAALGRQVHQRRLREADEGAGRGVAEREGDEKRPEPDREARSHGREREDEPAADGERAPPRRVAERPDDRVERAAEQAGQREQEAHLRVRETEMAADQRPGRRARAADELVEELDGEEDRDEGGPASRSRAGARHALEV